MIVLLFLLLGQGPAGGGSITGQILTAGGTPAVAVRVAAMPVDSQSPNVSVLAAITQTDGGGRYRLENLAPGAYHVAAGRVDEPTFYPGVTTKQSARTISVIAGASLAELDFRLLTPLNAPSTSIRFNGVTQTVALSSGQSFTLTGNVIVEPGEHVPIGTRVLLLPTGQGTPIRPDGSFQLDGVFPGTYKVRSSLAFPASSIPVVVTDKDVSGISLKLPLTVRVEGFVEVSGAPLSEAVSLSIRQTTDVNYWISVSTAQSFALDLPEGEYRIIPERIPEGYRIQSIAAGPANLLSGVLKIRRSESVRLTVTLVK